METTIRKKYEHKQKGAFLSVYNPATWQRFKSECMARKIVASKIIWKFIEQQLAEWSNKEIELTTKKEQTLKRDEKQKSNNCEFQAKPGYRLCEECMSIVTKDGSFTKEDFRI